MIKLYKKLFRANKEGKHETELTNEYNTDFSIDPNNHKPIEFNIRLKSYKDNGNYDNYFKITIDMQGALELRNQLDRFINYKLRI